MNKMGYFIYTPVGLKINGGSMAPFYVQTLRLHHPLQQTQPHGWVYMYFDFPAFIRYNFKAFFQTRGKNYRLTPKRFLILFFWLLLFIPSEIIYHLFLLLDEILFPGYRKTKVEKPVFIIGNPRSGTTFLHRIMDKDKQNFTSFQVWELIFAPSITQRKLIWALIGSPTFPKSWEPSW